MSSIALGALALSVLGASPDVTWDLAFERPAQTRAAEPRWNISLRFAPYRPRISANDATKRRYYNLTFGQRDTLFDGQPVMSSLEVDTYFAHLGGPFGVYARAGTWSVTAPTLVCATTGSEPCSAEQVSNGEASPGNDSNSLTIIPLSGGLVYRFDELRRSVAYLPLAPYIRAGANYFYWSNSQGERLARTASGERARGGSWGVEGTLGVAMSMDWIEPDAAARGRRSGVAGSFLFFEYNVARVDNFGSSRRLNMSDEYFGAGLSIELQ